MVIKICRMQDDVRLPEYQTDGSAGADIFAHLPNGVITIPSGACWRIPTKLQVEVPEGFELQIRPRSGLAFNHSVTVLNSPGTIDSDYRGEIAVLLQNHGHADIDICNGTRIAQAVLCPIYRAEWEVVGSVSKTDRGAGGFGSTGV